MMAINDHKSHEISQVLLLTTATALAALSGMIGIARQAAGFGPQVGDVVSFDPARPPPFDSDALLTAARPGQSACTLDVAFIQRSGGSFVIERRDDVPNRYYRTHWAGPGTSPDAGDCGTEADLILTQAAMASLAAAVGNRGNDGATASPLR